MGEIRYNQDVGLRRLEAGMGETIMVIRLTPDIENVLNEEARRQGVTPEQLALDSLGKLFLGSESSETPKGKMSLRFSCRARRRR